MSWPTSLLALAGLLSLAACAAPSGNKQGPGKVLVFECVGGVEFVADIHRQQTWLFLPGQTLSLPRATSGSGARYANRQISFWSKGDSALLDIPGDKTFDCSVNHKRSIWEDAKLRGIDFRAVGNEPGWMLEMDREWIVLETDYGTKHFRFPATPPTSAPQNRRSRFQTTAEEHDLEVLLEAKECRDSMSGERFETSVQVELDGEVLLGCGRALH